MFSFLANADPAATWTIHWKWLVTLGYKDWLFRLKVALFTTPFSSIRGMYTIPYAYKEWILFYIRIYANGYNVFEAIESL